LKLTIEGCEPYRAKDGSWKLRRYTKVEEYDNADNRKDELCVYCGFPDYPECLKWCDNGKSS
jgi:hypothetical protein